VLEAGRIVKYLQSSQDDKEAIARSIASEQRITQSPVCALSCVESCWGFDIHRNGETKELELVQRPRIRAGLGYRKQDNCFPWVADWEQAQPLMDRQLQTKWPKLLDEIAGHLNPIHKLTADGQINGHVRAEVTSELKRRQEGVRIKHRYNGNSVKLYDKAYTPVGSVLRVD